VFVEYFHSLESACFRYEWGGGSFTVGTSKKKIPDYKNSDDVVITIEVDMNQFVVDSFIFSYFFFLNRHTTHFFRGGSPFPYHVTGLPSSVHFGVCFVFCFVPFFLFCFVLLLFVNILFFSIVCVGVW
jgi:hypothetical protein